MNGFIDLVIDIERICGLDIWSYIRFELVNLLEEFLWFFKRLGIGVVCVFRFFFFLGILVNY